ncbi:MAG: exodeoxyribonuclease VII large subunit [Oscillospiraceae bacterium]|nr:exodeoxyribonuclease VII large subunit [Oscillospiraceae bacterium]
MRSIQVISVSQLNKYVKFLLEEDEALRTVCVTGEVSNFKRHYSGHWYFTLKDESAAVPAAMFKASNQRLPFLPQDGMSVIVRGRVSLYERDGKFQLYADDMQPDGLGALYMAYEQLKEKLSEEGLFDPGRKRAVPAIPARVGVITSETGAALRDILQILARRFPAAEALLCPVQVQGAGAAEQVAAAIRLMNGRRAADVLIVGRGGGSLEDLWAFNEELLVRAVAESEIPVISAVGHETDTTLCDFAADLRAPTPSAAAELAVPDARELACAAQGLEERIFRGMRQGLAWRRSALSALLSRRVLREPESVLQISRQRLDTAAQRVQEASLARLLEERARLSACRARLEALSPLAVLSRGYALARKGGKPVAYAQALSPGDLLSLRFQDGEVNVTVWG